MFSQIGINLVQTDDSHRSAKNVFSVDRMRSLQMGIQPAPKRDMNQYRKSVPRSMRGIAGKVTIHGGGGYMHVKEEEDTCIAKASQGL